MLEREAADKAAELRDEIAEVKEAIKSLRWARDASISWRHQRWQVMGVVERALHWSGVLKDQAIVGYEDDVSRAETALGELVARKKALEDQLGHCERPAEAAPAQQEEQAAAAHAVIARREEAETGLTEIRETPRDLDAHGGGDAPLPREEAGASSRSAPTADEPCKVGSGHGAPEAPFTLDTPVPSPIRGGAIAIPDPVPATTPQAAPPRRSGGAAATLTAAGLVVLGVAGIVVARGTILSTLIASVSETRPSRIDGRSEAAARAALPSTPILVSVKSRAAAASPPAAAAKPKPPPIAHERRAQTPGTSAAPVARPPKHKAPQSATSASTTPLRAAPARMKPSAPVREDRTLVDRSLGKSLRQAGDVKILEGDIASARLFYERAAAAGDAQAALYLGNSFNPAFLERLGVLGMRGDAVVAAQWYRRALSLGNPDAAKALRTLLR